MRASNPLLRVLPWLSAKRYQCYQIDGSAYNHSLGETSAILPNCAAKLFCNPEDGFLWLWESVTYRIAEYLRT